MRACKLTVVCCSFLSIAQTFAHNQLTVTGVDPDSFATSEHKCWNDSSGAQDVVLYTVPPGKTFVLTDVIAVGINGGAIREDANYIFSYSVDKSYHLVTGITINQNSIVDVDSDGTNSEGGCMTITGYLY